jgi:hypothetical protein
VIEFWLSATGLPPVVVSVGLLAMVHVLQVLHAMSAADLIAARVKLSQGCARTTDRSNEYY